MINIKFVARTILCLAFVLFIPEHGQAEGLQLRVIVQKANIRLRPDASSEIVTQVNMGTLLESDQKEGNWYRVLLPPDEMGVTRAAYIHSNIVEVVAAGAEARQETKAEPEAVQPMEKEPAQTGPAAPIAPPLPAGKLFSGFFFKGGLMVSPDAGGLSKTWMLGLGYDIGIAKNFSAGFELMPAYRNYSDINLSIVPVSFFINGKGGINVLKFLNILGGAGAGAEFTLAAMSFEGDAYTDFSARLALHLLLGLEFFLKPIAFFVEYQLATIPDKNVDPNFLRHFIFLGIRF